MNVIMSIPLGDDELFLKFGLPPIRFAQTHYCEFLRGSKPPGRLLQLDRAVRVQSNACAIENCSSRKVNSVFGGNILAGKRMQDH
jgi:hypothetical protein